MTDREPAGAAPSAADLDLLQELATIGAGQALTALGRLSRRPYAMDVPEAWGGRGPDAVLDFMGALGGELLAVGVSLTGLLAGHLVLALPGRDAERLAAALGQPVGPGPGRRWSPLAESALLEAGNVVGSAFVSAIARMVHGKLLLSVPALARGNGRACLQALLPPGAASLALATRFVSPGHFPQGGAEEGTGTGGSRGQRGAGGAHPPPARPLPARPPRRGAPRRFLSSVWSPVGGTEVRFLDRSLPCGRADPDQGFACK